MEKTKGDLLQHLVLEKYSPSFVNISELHGVGVLLVST